MATWLDLADEHYKACRPGRGSRLTTVSLSMASPGRARSAKAWLESGAGSEFVPEGWYRDRGHSWPVLEYEEQNVSLTVLCAPEMLPAVRGYVTSEMIPMIMSTVALLSSPSVRMFSPKGVCDIVYADIDFEDRCLPEAPGAAVLPKHINGGVTFFHGPTARILVYRREDACKVMIHELLHLHGIDEKLRGSYEEELSLRKRYGVSVAPGTTNVSLGLGEAYTEAMACYLHAIWLHHARGRPTNTLSSSIDAARANCERIAQVTIAHFGNSLAFLEATHCFAYVACRASLFRQPFMDKLHARYPPGHPPSDAREFTSLLIQALDSYQSEYQKSHAPKSKKIGWRMTR